MFYLNQFGSTDVVSHRDAYNTFRNELKNDDNPKHKIAEKIVNILISIFFFDGSAG